MGMDEQPKPDKIQAFDTLFTNNHIQVYKILLPYFEPPMQKQLAVFIKYMEFRYTLSYFHFPINQLTTSMAIPTLTAIFSLGATFPLARR